MAGPVLRAEPPDPVEVPILLVINQHAKWNNALLRDFRTKVWDEAAWCFAQSGVKLRIEERIGEVLKYPGGRPRFVGLDPKRLNVVLTDHVPLSWDQARYSAGVSRIYEGCHVCLIAVGVAHGNRVPLLALNSVVHELLHVFLQDIYAERGELMKGYDREVRVDWHATRLWLSRNHTAIKQAASEYVKKLRG